MCPLATSVFITSSIMLWWTLDSVKLPHVIEPKVVKEALQMEVREGSVKCKVTSIKPNWQANWTCNAITAFLLKVLSWYRLNLKLMFLISPQEHELDSVACRGLVMPGATAWLDAPFQILVLSSGVWWSLLLNTRYLWRHDMTSYSRLQTNKHAYSGTPGQGEQ